MENMSFSAAECSCHSCRGVNGAGYLFFKIVALILLQHALLLWLWAHEWLINRTLGVARKASLNPPKQGLGAGCTSLLQIWKKKADLVSHVGDCLVAVPGRCCRIFRSAHWGLMCLQTRRKTSVMPSDAGVGRAVLNSSCATTGVFSVAYLLWYYLILHLWVITLCGSERCTS